MTGKHPPVKLIEYPQNKSRARVPIALSGTQYLFQQLSNVPNI